LQLVLIVEDVPRAADFHRDVVGVVELFAEHEAPARSLAAEASQTTS
jgi:hypothetical protein